MRALNVLGRKLIRKEEACRLEAYECSASKKRPPEKKFWTIGWGHTGPEVKPGMHITQDEAERLFDADIAKFTICVDKATRELALTDNQFAALVSLTYTIGCGALWSSTLLRKLRAGDRMAAANEFLVWKYSSGSVDEGLVKRRAREREIFIRDEPARVV